jgi:hypothetical protein
MHYAGPGASINWTSEGSSVWTRDIPGIDGTLSAIQTSAGTTTLQLHDLRGNIVGTTGLSESEGLVTTYNSTEFGVPQPGTTPPKYAWQGATGLTSGLPDGTTAASGASYIPLIGKPLQTQGLSSPGAFPDGAAIAPVVQAAYIQAAAGQLESLAAQHEAELDEAARHHAEEEAAQNQCPASACDSHGVEATPEPTESGAEGETATEEVIGSMTFQPGENGAHAADVITCADIAIDYPHRSSHYPGTVNWEVRLACTGVVLNVRMRLALFWEGSPIADTGYVAKGDTVSATEHVTAPCISGWYTGWAYADLTPPPGYAGPTKMSGWSVNRYVTCPT